MKKNIAISSITLLIIGFFIWAKIHPTTPATSTSEADNGDAYERSYSVSFGSEDAPVTIVEFFDPACEACRAFHPFVKEILERHPTDVRLVLRYAPFHPGSETVIRMLEVAREQEVFSPVLEALLEDQNAWASHHKPNINKAWEIAEKAGLDVTGAKLRIGSTYLNSLIMQENDDIQTLKVRKTPTFFVNKRALNKFGYQQLYDLVIEEIRQSNK